MQSVRNEYATVPNKNIIFLKMYTWKFVHGGNVPPPFAVWINYYLNFILISDLYFLMRAQEYAFLSFCFFNTAFPLFIISPSQNVQHSAQCFRSIVLELDLASSSKWSGHLDPHTRQHGVLSSSLPGHYMGRKRKRAGGEKRRKEGRVKEQSTE